MWFNNFAEFERKQDRQNRLALNFCSPDMDRSVKVFAPKTLVVPTGFLTHNRMEALKEKMAQMPVFSQFPLSFHQPDNRGKFCIGSIEMPYDYNLIHALPKEFQIRNYDKLLRFRGFHPERKVSLSPDLESRFQSEDEIELENLEGINFTSEFLTAGELSALPQLYIDIEKPLWKHDDEKEMIDGRAELVKQEKRYEKLQKEMEKGAGYARKTHALATRRKWTATADGAGTYERWLKRYGKNITLDKALAEEEKQHPIRQARIAELEKLLTIQVEGVGDVPLYDKRFNADISHVTTIWTNPRKGTETREIYVIDPNDEITETTRNGYTVLRFKDEEGLIAALLRNLHERKPVISRGHNQVYDISQLTYAAGEHDITFDPAVKQVKPRRDVVIKFLQRLREDLIYIDTLWTHAILAPYLKQKSFGTNLKLASVAHHRGVDFEKSMSHDDLRGEQARALAGVTREIRAASHLKMLDYATADIDSTKAIADEEDKVFLPLLARLKQVLPYCTYSEISFSTNCMKKLHEFRHFARCGNLPYYGYKTKEREDERQIFKKRFPALKRNRIQNTSRISPIQGEHNGVGEYFFSLEEAFADWAFAIEPKLKPVYEWACAQARATEHTEQGQEQLFGFLQYLRDFMKDPFTDYYSARRDGIAYFNCKEVLFKRMARLLEGEKHSLAGHQDLRNIFEKSLASKFDQILNLVPSELRDEFIGSFRFLKNHFRSLYVDLDGGERRVVRPSSRQRTSLSETELFEEFADSVSFPEIAAPDTDIYLLKKHHKNVSRDFTPNQQRTLKSFLGNFEKFQQLSLEITGLMEKAGMTARGSSMFDLLYSFLYSHRCKEGDRVFEPKYRHSVAGINDRMKEVYQALASRLKDEGAQVVDYRGDYFFIKTNGDSPMNVPWLHKVRHLDEYSVGDRDTGAGTAELVF